MKTYKFIWTLTFLILFQSCDFHDKNFKIERYDDNTIKFLKRYRDNKLHGESVWFYPTGNVQEKVIFKNGKANGHAYYFYKSGALKSHRFWKNDKMIGYCADYYDDTVGIMQATLYFNENGELIYKKEFDKIGRVLKEEGKRFEE